MGQHPTTPTTVTGKHPNHALKHRFVMNAENAAAHIQWRYVHYVTLQQNVKDVSAECGLKREYTMSILPNVWDVRFLASSSAFIRNGVSIMLGGTLLNNL